MRRRWPSLPLTNGCRLSSITTQNWQWGLFFGVQPVPLMDQQRRNPLGISQRQIRESLATASGGSIFPAMPTKPATKKTVASKKKVNKPVEKNTAAKEAAPDTGGGLRVLKEVLHLSPSRKKAAPDKVEHLVREYLAKLREVDLTFENGAAVVEKYRGKYPELSKHVRRIVPEERLIEITQNLGDDADLRQFVIRVLDDDTLYEIIFSGEEKHQTVKSSEWLSLLQDTLARLIARIIYARETSKA
jgi:hypothetical protein